MPAERKKCSAQCTKPSPCQVNTGLANAAEVAEKTELEGIGDSRSGCPGREKSMGGVQERLRVLRFGNGDLGHNALLVLVLGPYKRSFGPIGALNLRPSG